MKKILLGTISILIAAAPAMAQHGGAKPRTTPTHAAPAPKTTHVSSQHGGSTAHGSSGPKASSPKAMKPSHGGGHATSKTTTRVAPAKATSKSKATTTTTKKGTTTVAPTSTTTTTLSPAQQKLQRNAKLASKLQSRLPAGTDVNLAASGFRNLGQFVAAVNVSNNLGIPFAQLKTRMVDDGMSLGQAIQATRPSTSDTTTVVRRAENDADVMIRTTDTAVASGKNKKVKKSTGGR